MAHGPARGHHVHYEHSGLCRFIRANLLEVVNQDYIRTARSKGLSERAILLGHALKNAALPLVTIVGMDLPILLGGAVVTESIFAWPGMGRLFWGAAQDSDIPVLMGVLTLISVAVVGFQIITDIIHILPNSMASIIVSATLGVAGAILSEAYVSFLGVGVQAPTATWGNMLDQAYHYLETEPWMWIFPGLFILLTVLSINFLGDGLRDALDPRTRI